MALYIETYRPCYPETGTKVRVHRGDNFTRDSLSPDMTSVFLVDGATSKVEALALIAEKFAGKNVPVTKVF